MNDIHNPLCFKRFRKEVRLSFAIILLLTFSFCLSSCNETKKQHVGEKKYIITTEERQWLREFFHDLLFKDPGAFVLYGTKPMSWSSLHTALSLQEEQQLKSWYEALSPEEKLNYNRQESLLTDFNGNFKKWQSIKDRFSINQYLFGVFPPRYEGDTEDSLLFINIEMSLRTLLKYYPDFRRILGYDFDPIEAVFEVENKDSKFWNTVLHNDILLGIMLGFGSDNSWFFEWDQRYADKNTRISNFIKGIPSHFSSVINNSLPNPQNLQLPVFRNYGLYPTDSEIIQQYEQERKKIEMLYKGKDEVDLALEWLTR